MASAPILITADEVNCLIYSYFQDSGFQHSAFAIRTEGRLEQSHNFQKRIPRGELVELLSKALLYAEVETHWRGNAMTTDCKAGFSLLDNHVCSADGAGKIPSTSVAPAPTPAPLLRDVAMARVDANDAAQKRKASTPATDDGRAEKRLKKDREAETPMQETPSTLDARGAQNDQISDTVLFDSAAARKPKQIKSPVQEEEELDPDTVRLLQGHMTEVFVCAWNPKLPNILASGSKDAIVNIWNLPVPPRDGSARAPPSGEPKTLAYYPKDEQGDLTSLDWNHDGSLLAIGSYDAILRVCNADGELYFSDPKHQGPIFATRFSKSGRWLLTASLDSTACVWDVKEKRLQTQYKTHTDCCLDVDWLNDEFFASCGADKVIHIMNLARDAPLRTFGGHTNEINQIKFNPARTRLASCSDDKTARIWDTSSVSATEKHTFVTNAIVLEGHRGHVSGISWCPRPTEAGNEMLATSSFDNTARLWDAVTGACLHVFTNHKRPIYTITFAPSGRWLATGSGDGWLHVYDVRAREKVWSWRSDTVKRGIFEVDWQQTDTCDRIALALESKKVAVIDVARVPALQRREADA